MANWECNLGMAPGKGLGGKGTLETSEMWGELREGPGVAQLWERLGQAGTSRDGDTGTRRDWDTGTKWDWDMGTRRDGDMGMCQQGWGHGDKQGWGHRDKQGWGHSQAPIQTPLSQPLSEPALFSRRPRDPLAGSRGKSCIINDHLHNLHNE